MRLAFRHHLITLLLCAGLTCASLPLISKLKYVFVADELHEPNLAEDHDFRAFQAEYNDNYSAVYFTPPQKWTEQDLCTLRQTIETIRLTNPDIKNITSAFSLRQPQFKSNPNQINYPLLLDLNCLSPAKTEFDFTKLKESPFAKPLYGEKNELAFVVEFENSPSDFSNKFNPLHFRQLDESLKKLSPSLNVTGTGAFLNAVHSGISNGQIINVLVFLFIIILFRFLWGTWTSGLIYTLIISLTVIFIFALKALFDSPYDSMTDSLILVVAIANLEDFVFVSYAQLKFKVNAVRSIFKLSMASFLTSFTTFLGFISLTSSNIQMIVRLGIWIALSAMLQWVILFMVIPALFKLVSKKAQWVNPSKAFDFSRLKTFNLNLKIHKAWLLVVPLGFTSVYFFQINYNDLSLFHDNHPFKQQTLAYLDSFRKIHAFQVLIPKDVSEENVSNVKNQISKISHITEVEDQQEIKNYLTAKIPTDYQQMLTDQLQSSNAISKFNSNNYQRLIAWTDLNDFKEISSLTSQLKSTCASYNCTVTGSVVKSAAINLEIPKTLFHGFIISLFLVGAVLVFLSLALYSGKIALPVIVSSFFGPAVIMLVIFIFQIQADFLTGIFLTALTGIAGDNVIQFLVASRKKKNVVSGINDFSHAALITTFVMSVCSLLFLFSDFYPSQKFGPMLAAGLILTYIGDVLILRSVIGDKH